MLSKKIKIAILSILLLHCGLENQAQQLPQFSQYIFNGLHINPGYAGYKNEGYIQTTYRRQWVNFPGAPRTMSVTGDFSFNEGSMGLGVSYLRDKIGLTESNMALATYAYRINTGDRGRLSLGLSGGVAEYVLDPSEIVIVNPNDPDLPMARLSVAAPTMNTGLFYHNDMFYAGLSAYNLTGKRSLERQDMALGFHEIHYYFTMGALLPFSDNFQFKPSFLMKHTNGAPSSIDFNAMLLVKEKLWVGGSLRSNVRVFQDDLQENLNRRNSVAIIAEYFISPGMRIGYSYDHNLSVLSNLRNESHELSIGIYLKGKRAIINNPRWF